MTDRFCKCDCSKCLIAGAAWSTHCNTCSFFGSQSLPQPVAAPQEEQPSAKQKVLRVHPNAYAQWHVARWMVFRYAGSGIDGYGLTEAEAWEDAASKLLEPAAVPETPESAPATQKAIILLRSNAAKCQVCREALTALETPESAEEELELDLSQMVRLELFLSHVCQGTYGDDGEMQCNVTPRIDFKRDFPSEILAKSAIHRLIRAAQFHAERKSPVEAAPPDNTGAAAGTEIRWNESAQVFFVDFGPRVRFTATRTAAIQLSDALRAATRKEKD